MATVDQIARLRRMIDAVDDDSVYTDELLSDLIDVEGFEASAAMIWKEKASSFAALVDMTESGSTRRLSQLADQALKMAATFVPEPSTDTSGGSYTVGITRV